MSSPVETLREALGTSPAQAARQAARSISPWDVLQGGIAGWIGMTALMWAGRVTGLMPPARMDIIDLEGTFFASPYTAKAQTIGFLAHLGMSLWIAFVYALGFKWLRLRPDWRSGAFGSLVHCLIAATVVGWWSKINPHRRQQAAPGFAGFSQGVVGAAGFFLGHVVYGMLVGHVYGSWQRHSR